MGRRSLSTDCPETFKRGFGVQGDLSQMGKAVGRVRGREPCRGEALGNWGIGLPTVPALAVGTAQLSKDGRASLR